MCQLNIFGDFMDENKELKKQLNATKQQLVIMQMNVLQYQMTELKLEEASFNAPQEQEECQQS